MELPSTGGGSLGTARLALATLALALGALLAAATRRHYRFDASTE